MKYVKICVKWKPVVPSDSFKVEEFKSIKAASKAILENRKSEIQEVWGVDSDGVETPLTVKWSVKLLDNLTTQ